MKKTKDSRETALMLAEALENICLCANDWESYGGRPIPEHLLGVLEALHGEISTEAGELRDWLDKEIE